MEATSAASPLDLIPGGARAGPPEVGCHVGGGGPGSPGGALAASRHPPSLSRSYPPHAAHLTPEAQTVTYRRRMGSDRCRTGRVTGSSPRTGLESWKRGADRRSGRETQAGPAQRQSSVRRVCGPSAAGGLSSQPQRRSGVHFRPACRSPFIAPTPMGACKAEPTSPGCCHAVTGSAVFPQSPSPGTSGHWGGRPPHLYPRTQRMLAH